MHAKHYVHGLRLRNTAVRLKHTAGEGVNSTSIQCVHEQSVTGICIFSVFYFSSNGSPMYKSLLFQTELETHEILKRVTSANAILKHYKSSSLITV